MSLAVAGLLAFCFSYLIVEGGLNKMILSRGERIFLYAIIIFSGACFGVVAYELNEYREHRSKYGCLQMPTITVPQPMEVSNVVF